MKQRSDRSLSFITLSLMIHGGLAVALTMASDLLPLPEGTQELTQIEFTNQLPPLGQQLESQPVTEEKTPESTPVEEVRQKVEKPEPEPEPGPEIAKTTINKTHVPQVLPKKAVVASPTQSTQKAITNIESPVAIVDKTALNEKSELEDPLAPANLEETKPSEIEDTEIQPVASFESPEEEDLEEFYKEDDYYDENEEFDNALAIDDFEETESQPDLAKENIENMEPKEEAIEKLVLTQNESITSHQEHSQLSQETQNLATEKSILPYGVPNGVRDVKELVQVPGNVPPQYPANSRRKREMGQVKLQYFVTKEGRVTDLRLVKSSGYADLDNEALRAINKYRFRSGQQGETSHTVNFVLSGDATPSGGTLRTSSHDNEKLPARTTFNN